MAALPFLAALMLVSQPATPPERLDPDDIEALEALLEALSREEGLTSGEDAEPEPAPEAEADAEEAASPAAPAPSGQATDDEAPEPPASDAPFTYAAMGPHVGAADYEAVRGTPLGAGTRISWTVRVRPLDAQGALLPDNDASEDDASATERRFIAGNGWGGEETQTGFTLNDFTTRRQLRVNTEAGSFTNSSLYALARRNLDIYVFLSEGGQRDIIAFGSDTSFERFWLEAAMGVAAAPAELVSSTTRNGDGSTVLSWQRNGDDRVIASAHYGGCGALDATRARFMLAGLGHKLALHPDLIGALHERGDVPCAFSFVIISPDSPQGRIEHWTREGSEAATIDLVSLAGLSLVVPEQDLLDDSVIEAALAATRGQLGAPPAAPEFLAGIQTLRSRGDYAGALLLLTQETAHFGPCPAETIGSERIACTSLPALLQAGIGNAAMARAVEASEAIADGAHRTAIENLRGFVTRSDDAGAAARTMLANEVLSMGAEGLAEYADIDPVGLLEQALVIDPFAPDAYWHLGRRYMEAGAPEAAWTLFDLGRALDGREPTPLLRQAVRIEEGVEQLAPRLFGPPAQ